MPGTDVIGLLTALLEEWRACRVAGDDRRERQALASANALADGCRLSLLRPWLLARLGQVGPWGEAAGCWFVAGLYSRRPVPRKLAVELLRAGLLAGDATTIREFVTPVAQTFGRERTQAWLDDLQGRLEFLAETPERLRMRSALPWAIYHLQGRENRRIRR